MGDGHIKLHVGLIGCGKFALSYHAPALESDPRVRLAVVCDAVPSPIIANFAARTRASITTSLEAALGAEPLDAVIISTPHALHADHILRALSGAKHVLVDKPFVLNGRDADYLSHIAGEKGVVAAVAFNRHFDRGFCYAREVIQAGDLGPIRFVQSVQLGYPDSDWYVDPNLGGGGPFVGRVSHFADVVPWILATPPQRVRAIVREATGHRTDFGGHIDIDFGEIMWRATALCDGCWMWDEVRLYGDNGVLEVRRPANSLLEWQATHFDRERNTYRIIEPGRIGSATSDFIDAVLQRRKPETTFEEARFSVRVVETAYESARRRGEWVLV